MNPLIVGLKREQLKPSADALRKARASFKTLREMLPIPDVHPRILSWDIEATGLALDFGRIFCVGFQWITGKSVKHAGCDLRGHYEWSGGRVVVRSQTDYPDYLTDHSSDKALTTEVSDYLSQADLWAFHFGEFFDIKAVCTRLALHQKFPMPPIKFVDNWRLARILKLHSNRLDSVAKFLDLPEKTPILPQVWAAACGGYPWAVRYIEDHCKHDLPPLTESYLRLRPFKRDHPNMNLTHTSLADMNTNRCPQCLWPHLTRIGHSFARTRIRDRWQCAKCGNCAVGITSGIVGEGIR